MIKFWRNSVGNFFSANLFQNFRSMYFFNAKHFIGHILGMIGLIDVKQKESTCTSVGYWVNYDTLTFDLTHDFGLGFLRSKFKIAVHV